MAQPAQDFNVRHDAVAADDSREVLHRRKKCDLFIDRDNLVVIQAQVIAIPLHLLGPGNHQAEVGGLSELREFGGLWRREDPGFHAQRLEVSGSPLAHSWGKRSDELRIVKKGLDHANVLAAHRTVHHGGAGSLRNGARRPNCYGAVDNRQRRFEMFDTACDFTHEILDLERKGDVHDVDPLELFHHGLDVHADRLVMSARDFKKRSPHLSKPRNNNFLGFSHMPEILTDSKHYWVYRHRSTKYLPVSVPAESLASVPRLCREGSSLQ